MFLTALIEGMEKEQLDGPPSKTRRLSLSLKRPLREANCSPLPTHPDLVEKASKGVIPYSTLQNTNWAVGTLLSWVKQRNHLVSEQFEPDILSCRDAECLLYVLRLSMMEARKVDNKRYSPGTIRCLLSKISRDS